MALFKRKKKEEVVTPTPAGAQNAVSKAVPAVVATTPLVDARAKRAVDGVLLRPRITEKATDGTAHGCYVFDIPKSATKRDVARAVAVRYGVTPRMVRTAMIKSKNVVTRRSNRAGVKPGGKKAYVYLNAGDKIELA